MQAQTTRPSSAPLTPRITRVGSGFYSVASRTEANVSYAVLLHDMGTSACTCPAGLHGRPCWHVSAARGAEALYTTFYGFAPLAPAPATRDFGACRARRAATAKAGRRHEEGDWHAMTGLDEGEPDVDPEGDLSYLESINR